MSGDGKRHGHAEEVAPALDRASSGVRIDSPEETRPKAISEAFVFVSLPSFVPQPHIPSH